MLKKYQAKSHVSISVSLKGGKCTHIQFSPLTQGGSVFYTEDKALQEALEAHHKYGKLFKAVEEHSSVKNRGELSNIADDTSSEYGDRIANGNGNDNKDDSVNKPNAIEVACAEDAKEYLVDKFGISRTKLRSVKAIKESAEANNIEFVGI